jgi:peptidoglycan hydrolase-like protein with peptidoglycan-binding domain
MAADNTEITESYGELRLHTSGEWVSYAQQLLAAHGFGPDDQDGDFTERTEELVRGFQEYSGLTADGVVDTATWSALQATPSSGGYAGPSGGGAPAWRLEFATNPQVSGIGMEWTVTNVGSGSVPEFTRLGDYEVWDRNDITVTVARSNTFNTLHEIAPGGTEPFFIDLESITPGDGRYKAVVQMGTEIRELDFDVVGLKVRVP